MKNQEKVKKYYRECDSSYQHWGEEEIYNIHYGFWEDGVDSHTKSLNNMNRFLAERAVIEKGLRVLDAGCGVGASSIWLAENYDDINVTGITISELQCEKANAFAKKRGLSDRVKFYVNDFNSTDFPDGSFDMVWGLESICYAVQKEGFIKEAWRLLDDRGRIIVADGFVAKEPYDRLDEYFMKRWLEGWVVPNLATVDGFRKSLEKMGFKNIDFKDITKNVKPSAREIFKRGCLGWPAYKIKRKNKLKMKHVKGCIFQYLGLKRGSWKYGVFYAEK